MRHIPCLVKNELRSLFFSPAIYIAGIIFTLLLGAFYFNVLNDFSREAQVIYPSEAFFKLFWIPVWFLVPLLTMRSIAEERRKGTLEILMTAPVSVGEIVLGKFLAVYIVYILFWALALLFPLMTVWVMDSPLAATSLLDLPSLFGGYLFIMLSGFLFIAIGIFSSSLTRTQLIAGMLTFTFLFIITVSANFLEYDYFAFPLPVEGIDGLINYLRIFAYLEDFSKGVIDSRPFFSTSAIQS